MPCFRFVFALASAPVIPSFSDIAGSTAEELSNVISGRAILREWTSSDRDPTAGPERRGERAPSGAHRRAFVDAEERKFETKRLLDRGIPERFQWCSVLIVLEEAMRRVGKDRRLLLWVSLVFGG